MHFHNSIKAFLREFLRCLATSCSDCHAISLGSLWRNKTKTRKWIPLEPDSCSGFWLCDRASPVIRRSNYLLFILYHLIPTRPLRSFKIYTTSEPLKETLCRWRFLSCRGRNFERYFFSTMRSIWCDQSPLWEAKFCLSQIRLLIQNSTVKQFMKVQGGVLKVTLKLILVFCLIPLYFNPHRKWNKPSHVADSKITSFIQMYICIKSAVSTDVRHGFISSQ